MNQLEMNELKDDLASMTLPQLLNRVHGLMARIGFIDPNTGEAYNQEAIDKLFLSKKAQ